MLVSGALLTILFVVLRNFCPISGIALTRSRLAIHRLKNRTSTPGPADFDERATLAGLLAPGSDTGRWSQSQAARLEGYVVSVSEGPLEAANCYCARDVHIMLAERVDAPPTKQIVLEITPRFHLSARPGQELVGHRVRFEGWLLFDWQHAGEAENTSPRRVENWRASGWELHPVTKFEILDRK